MLLISDKSYLDAKQLKRGKKLLKEPFAALAKWISCKYDVSVLNIVPEKILPGDRPRLSIAVEYERDHARLCTKDRFTCNARKAAAVSKKYIELIENAPGCRSVTVQKTRALVEKQELQRDGVRIWVDAFEPLAKQEANSNVKEEDIEALKTQLGLCDLWTVFHGLNIPLFFFFTQAQVAQRTADGTIEAVKAAYFEVLKRTDEFDYFTFDTFRIALDSKENFDTRYSGNWYYYLK